MNTIKLNDNTYVSLVDAADYLEISVSSLHRLVRAGKLPQPTNIRLSSLWKLSDLNDFKKNNPSSIQQEDKKSIVINNNIYITSVCAMRLLGVSEVTFSRQAQTLRRMKIGQQYYYLKSAVEELAAKRKKK